MRKLLVAAMAQPTEANIEKLAKYLRKHPMALVFADPEELAWCHQHGLT
jgi:hypothetical protein